MAQSVVLSSAPAPAPFTVDVERPGDVAARERLLDLAMGPGRFAKSSERLREGRLPALALVARDRAGGVVGTVRLWHVEAGSAGPALLLGPLATHPWWRGRGIGARLMRAALHRAAALGHRAVLLVGDAPYYARFGFAPTLTTGLDMAGEFDRARFLGLELVAGALAGARGLLVATGAPVRRPRPSRRRSALTAPARRAS